MVCVHCFGKACLSEEMNFNFLWSSFLNFGPWDLLRKSSRHVQSVFRFTLREIYMKLDLKCILQVPFKGRGKYFLISNLKLVIYIYTCTGKMQSFFVMVLKMFSTQSLTKYQPDAQCKLAGMQYLNLYL